METDTRAVIADITETLSVDPRVVPGTGFGAGHGLRVDGRIFVIFMPDVLVLKLPASRVGELIAQTGATPFDAGKGKPMREWVRVSAERRAEWADLAQEALRYVARG